MTREEVYKEPGFERGYVVRQYDLSNGKIIYFGNTSRDKYREDKESFTDKETYTISGAKRALSNMKRLYPNSSCDWSVERLDRYLVKQNQKSKDEKKKTEEYYQQAMQRLDELEEGNSFHNGDKMRINEVRYYLRLMREHH